MDMSWRRNSSSTTRPVVDKALLRGRRGIEWAGLISRGVAIIWILVSYSVLPMPDPAMSWPLRPFVFGLLAALPVALINVLAVLALRNVASVRYLWMSATSVTTDTAAIIGVTILVMRDRSVELWPLLVVPVLLAAYRHQLVGAFFAWLATTAAAVTIYHASVPLLGHQVDQDMVTTGPALNLVVAVMTGMLSRAHHRQLRQLIEIRRELQHQVLHDPLTGLGNRRMLHEHTRVACVSKELVSVLVLDLDRFKAVNDTLGHAVGDELLRFVAGQLLHHARKGDLVIRLGGDEFGIVLRGVEVHHAREIAERLRSILSAPIDLAGEKVVVGVSIGVASATEGELDALLRMADADMYHVKARRRPRPAVTA
jgi:diguanylate cyclase (GGDEF)-like protein